MGVDTRVGKKDYFTRYKVYPTDTNIKNCDVTKVECLGILHAKDVTSYATNPEIISDRVASNVARATIETQDRIEIKPNYKLYCLQEATWYIVESVSPNSNNDSQRFSSRPINVTQLVIRRGA